MSCTRWIPKDRVSRRRELYKLRMARETPEEREARLIRQREYMRRRRANERQQQLQVEPDTKWMISVNGCNSVESLIRLWMYVIKKKLISVLS